MELEAKYAVVIVIIYPLENNMYVFLVSILTMVKYHVEYGTSRFSTWTFADFIVMSTLLVVVFPVQLLNYCR